MRSDVALTGLLLLAGCGGGNPSHVYTVPGPDFTKPVILRVISDPPGARITVEDDYIGDAPIDYRLPRHLLVGYGGDVGIGCLVITAIPAGSGEYEQWVMLGPAPVGDATPFKTVLFDMRLRGSSPPSLIVIPIE